MATPLVINGVTYQYPQQFDKNWGPVATNWASAVTTGMLQKAGGSFPLTAEVDFGSSFGVKLKSIKSAESNIAATGFLRLGNASPGIVWRNALNNADLPLTVNASNQLTFNGVSIGATTSLTDGHILVGDVSNQPADVAMSGDIAITNAGVTSIGAGKIVDSQINASADIALSKLAAVSAYQWLTGNAGGVLGGTSVTASRAVATDANGLPVASATTATELGYVSGVGSAIQTQINGLLPLTGGTLSGILNMGGQRIAAVATPTTNGDAAQYPITNTQISAGTLKVVQIIAATASSNFTTTSSTYQSTNLTASITPTSASNKILVLTSGVLINTNPSVTNAYITVFRGSTNLGVGANAALGVSISGGTSTTNQIVSPFVVDSPSTTSSTTYTVKIFSSNNSTNVSFGSDMLQSILLVEIVA